MKTKKWLSLLLASLMMLSVLAGCGNGTQTPSAEPSVTPSGVPAESVSPTSGQEKTKINLALLSGPTGVGAAKLLSDNEAGTTKNQYDVTIATAPDELTGKIVSGEIDIAALSTNLAAALYQKTNGKVQLAAINTLGVLYILENGEEIQSMADLKGKTIYAFGQGANPEYVLRYLLEKNGLKEGQDVTVEFKASEEIVAAMASGQAKVAMLPVPATTTVLMKNKSVRAALDLTEEWNKTTEDSQLTMGCIVVRKEFAEQNPEAVKAFLEEYEASVNYVKENVDDAAQMVAKFGITGNAEIAKAAIPQCNLTCIIGEDMRTAIQGYYEVLFAAEPSSIGGQQPDDAFYYIP
jgi:NitT/TauT family transport system substrate-binding protein